MNCRTVRTLTSAYLEEEVTVEERRGIDAHLQDCSRCSTSLFHASRVVSLLHGLPRVAASEDFVEQVAARAARATAAPARRWAFGLTGLAARLRTLPELRLPPVVWAPGFATALLLVGLVGIRGGLTPRIAERPDTSDRAVATAPATDAASTAVPSHGAPLPGVRPLAALTSDTHGARLAADTAPERAAGVAQGVPQGVAGGGELARGAGEWSLGGETGEEIALAAAAPGTGAPAGENPLASTAAVGPQGLVLEGRGLFDPPTEVDLVLERVTADRAGVVRLVGADARDARSARRRYWTF